MMPRYENETGSIGARGRKMTARRRPLLVGALAAGMLALGAGGTRSEAMGRYRA